MSFVGLYTGLSGIRAAQTGIDTTSHNIANASTPGYTRQRVEQTSAPSYQSPAGPIGTGVEIDQIARLRDGFLDARYRSTVGEQGAAGARAELLSSLEVLSGEPENGISGKLGRLWEAAESWSNAPDDDATRRQVISELESVSQTVRSVAGAWDTLGADTTSRRSAVIDTVNGRLAALDGLNSQLANADPARVDPALYDQRDRLLDEVAQLTGATISQENGRATARLDGHSLLDAGGYATLQAAGDGLLVTPTGDAPAGTRGPGQDIEVASGELGGLQTFLADLDRLRGDLDGFATTFAGALNELNQDGRDRNGDPGIRLFANGPIDAADLRLRDEVTPSHLAGASATGDFLPHDSSNAERFADLRTTPLDAAGVGDPGGASIEDRHADLVVGLAGDVRAAEAGAEAARTTARGAELARTAEHGVSTDEEMVGLVRYQRSLEAASRVMTTIDEALEVLVNRTGIVGR